MDFEKYEEDVPTTADRRESERKFLVSQYEDWVEAHKTQVQKDLEWAAKKAASAAQRVADDAAWSVKSELMTLVKRSDLFNIERVLKSHPSVIYIRIMERTGLLGSVIEKIKIHRPELLDFLKEEIQKLSVAESQENRARWAAEKAMKTEEAFVAAWIGEFQLANPEWRRRVYY